METKLVLPSEDSLSEAARLILADELVAMPTETVYGLAANAFSDVAVSKIYKAKGRPQDNPLILHIAEFRMLNDLASEVSDLAKALAEEFWPGPLTIIFPKSGKVPQGTNGGLDTVAVRSPDNEIALKLIQKCGVPLAAPSANTSGKPSPTSARHVLDDMDGRIPMIIDGGECVCGIESTVILPQNDSIRVLRPGSVSVEQLERFAPVVLDKSALHKLDASEKAISPGTKYKHYSPLAEVVLVCSESGERFSEYFLSQYKDGDIAVTKARQSDVPHIFYGANVEEQAHSVFAALRRADELGAKRVFVHAPEKQGVGLAVYNRLLRAAGFRVIEI